MKYQASLIAQLAKNPPEMQETPFNSWVWKICWKWDRLPTPLFLGFPCGSAGKESTCNVGDLGSIPGLGISSGEGKGYPLPYSGLEDSMDCRVHGVTKSRTQLSDFHFHIPMKGFPRWSSGKESACQHRRHKRRGFNPWIGKIPLEQEMATHSSIPAWKTPWTEEPSGYSPLGCEELDMTEHKYTYL